MGLNIKIEANLKIVDFLDVTFDLNTGLHMPYMKPNNTIQYVNTSSNHPQPVIDNIPKGVEERLSMLSSNEEIFNRAIPPYQDALKKAGHKYKLKFRPNQRKSNRNRARKRNTIWYNPPFCRSIKTQIGKRFFHILDTCFPPSNPLSKIFNRHTVKLSYSCMPNMGKLISGHNKKLIKTENTTEREANCRDPTQCPLGQECLTKDVIYQAQVKRADKDTVEKYVGLTSTPFKLRWSNHKVSFTHPSRQNETKLSTYIWDLKRQGIAFELNWKILEKSNSYSPSTKKCWLCIKEKYFILFKPKEATINMRHEFFSPCPHKAKYKLSQQK